MLSRPYGTRQPFHHYGVQSTHSYELPPPPKDHLCEACLRTPFGTGMMRAPKNLQILIGIVLFREHQNARVHLIQKMGMMKPNAISDNGRIFWLTMTIQREAITSLTTLQCATSACHTFPGRRSQFQDTTFSKLS